MTRGTKRGGGEAAEPRATKVAKTDNSSKSTSKKAVPGKHAPSVADFKSKALPLHVNITHTPPSIQKEGGIDSNGDEEVPVVDAGMPDDVGLIGRLTLVPSTFSTGSYGWKGNHRIVVELQGSEGGEGGKEKVQVMLNINATVIGSKPPKAGRKKVGASKEEEVLEAGEEDVSEQEQ